jgi:long-subunit acyl-CoA synthetase (AMP-forming)
VNADLPDYAKLKTLVIASEPWTIENGCLTPTMKIKRTRIESAVAPLVDRWYAGNRPVQWA